MADLKISQLSSATALAGTEVVPVVQSGATKKATIDQILSPASGKGIDFSAAGGDTLKMYDEGTWTPTDASGAGLTFANVSAGYVRIGKMVFAYCRITYPATANTDAAVVGGLPFTIENSQAARQANITYSSQSTATFLFPVPNATTAVFFNAAGAVTNAQMSGSDNWLFFSYPAA